MEWNKLANWKKNYLAVTFAIWSLTISISMVFYLGTGGNDLPPAPFVFGFIVFLLAMLIYFPVNVIMIRKTGGNNFSFKNILFLIIDLFVLLYFLFLFLTYRDVYLGFL